jgi:hypothetical protein
MMSMLATKGRAGRCCHRRLYRYATQHTNDVVTVMPFDAATAMVVFMSFFSIG